MKVGVIGLGPMGCAHARVYKQIQGCELAGICDTDPEKKYVAEMYHSPFFSSWQDLLQQELDAVSICTPTSAHEEIANLFMENGCDVLVEKPLANGVEGGKRILKKAEDMGKLVAVGYVERFNPAIKKLKDTVDFSKIFSTLSLRFGPGSPRIKDIGVLMDLGSHEIDILNYIMDTRPRVIYAQVSNGSNYAFEEYAYISLRYGHVHSHIETSWLPQYKLRVQFLYGNEKFYTLNYAQQSIKSHRPPPHFQIENGNWQDVLWMSRNIEDDLPISPAEPLRLELQCFLESVEKGEILDPLCGCSDGIGVLETIQEAFKVSKQQSLGDSVG